MIAKFRPVGIQVTKNPIFLVGMCPGKQRKKNDTCVVWEGNRSGDIMQEIIKGYGNLYLTNVFNIYTDADVSPGQVEDGVVELASDIKKYSPKAIICFGSFAMKKVKELGIKTQVLMFQHPSYISRFGKDKKEYIQSVRTALQSLISNEKVPV